MNAFPFVSLALTVAAASASSPQRSATPLAAQQDSGWLAAASAEVERAEYHFNVVRDEPEVWSAPNRAHEFRSRVSARGLEVFPRTTSADGQGAPWKLHLRTARFGRTEGSFELPPPTVTVTGERVELDHGCAVEWFENTAQGLEQGWTIPARPLGTGELWIGLEIEGDLSFRIDDSGRSGVFVDACGDTILRYRDLLFFDATGRKFGARLASSPEGVGLRIDDAGASYPITVDPLLTGQAWTAESNQALAKFGSSVAFAGDVNGDGFSDVIVGAPDHDNKGRAFVYLGSSTGLATTSSWTAEGNLGSHFGSSVASAGDVNGDGFSDVLVGAPDYDNAGRTFLFEGSANGLSSNPLWTAESSQANSLFGSSVASAGDVNGDGFSDVIVGAYAYDNGETDEGRAYLYLGSATGLSANAAWTAEGDLATAGFGISAASAGDVNGDGFCDVIVGAFAYDLSSYNSNDGRAYVYLGSTTGLAALPAWTSFPSVVQTQAYFGRSVSTAGDVNGDGFADVIIGAPEFQFGEGGEGRAFLYLGSPTGLSLTPDWADSDQTGALFGWSVSTAGDVNGDGFSDVTIGAPAFFNPEPRVGCVFTYLGGSGGLATTPESRTEFDQALASYEGLSSSPAGDVNGDGFSDVIVGVPGYDNGETDEGRAFVYHGSASDLEASPAWSAEGDQVDSDFGTCVAGAGDVNGDGYGDVAVGAPLFDNGEGDEGRAFVYLGSSSGPSASAAWTGESDQAGANFGFSLASAGDVNGDGYGDLIVGAHRFDNGQSNEGRSYVYLGAPSGLATSAVWTAEGEQSFAFFGSAVASVGDVNGDGYGDVIVGAHRADGGQADEGRAYVYLGTPSGPAASPAWTAEGDQASAYFGYSVAGAGDVNGDGYGDALVGALRYSNGQTEEGRAYVYLGSPSGLAPNPAWTAEGDQAFVAFGVSVASAGNVNGDGFSDVIVGASAFDNGEFSEGRAYVYAGSSSGLAPSPAWTAESDQAGAYFGLSVASAGDVNGDGYGDVLVGADGFESGQLLEGRAFVYLGSASGPAPSPAWTADGDQDGVLFGRSVAGAGDVNGDGYSDVIVGARYFDAGQLDEGRAWVWLGNEGAGGLVRTLQQRTKSGNRPLSVVGALGRDGLFRIRCEFPRNAAGFAWASPAAPEAWLEWEVKPLGVAFDGTDVQAGTPQALGAGGGTLTFDELVAVPDPITGRARLAPQSHHWRARIATNNPLFPNTAWFSVQGSNITEAKVRKTWR